MATKTISIDLEAYARLARARRVANESFSQVIKRAEWKPVARTGAAFEQATRGLPVIGEEVLQALEADQRADQPPDDPWTRH